MNILLISWYFPPANDVGAVRTGRIAEFLQNNGQNISVLTAERQHSDASLTIPFAKDRIARTAWFDVDTFNFRPNRNEKRPTHKPKKIEESDARPFGRNPIRAKLAEHYRHLIRIPDRQIGWLPYLLNAAQRIHRAQGIDLIYASGPPFTTFMGADVLSRRFGIPWVAEYRDAWSRYIYAPRPKWRQTIDVFLEDRVLATAAGIVAISQPWANYYEARFKKPTAAIYNGFDEERTLDLSSSCCRSETTLSITYMGVMYGGLRDPSCLYEALKLSGLTPADVKVNFYGPEVEEILPLAEKCGVGRFVQVHDRVSHRESLAVQRNSDVLLLLQSPDDPRNIPAKTFEYFAVRRPILGLGLDIGEPARLIRDRAAGLYVTEPEMVARQLKLWVAEKRETGSIPDLPASARMGLSRDEQLEKLDRFLASIHASSRHARTVRDGSVARPYVKVRDALPAVHPEWQFGPAATARRTSQSLRPLLVTTIDAEESFDWTKSLSRHYRDVRAMREQRVCHSLFDRYKVIPTYFATYPVVTQDEGSAFLTECQQSGKCEIGAQLHPWVTPPFVEPLSLYNSFPGNLPEAWEFAKLETLTNAIQDQFEVRPTMYRAGRYGIGPHTAGILLKLGYRIDSSVVPEQSYRDEGGPEFFGRSVFPHWLDEEEKLLELPLTSAYVGRMAGRSNRLNLALFDQGHRCAIIRSVMARSRMIERIRLTPEGTRIHEAKRLVRSLLRRGCKTFVLSYHTPSLIPGSTPYVRDNADRDRFLNWLDEFYEFFFGEIGGMPAVPADICKEVPRTRAFHTEVV